MAVNVPLVTISGLTEQTTAADTDCMVIGGTDAKKIKWSTIISLIKSKLGIGNASLNGIGDGTITGAISSLNTNISLNNTWYFGFEIAGYGFVIPIATHRSQNGIATISVFNDSFAWVYPTIKGTGSVGGMYVIVCNDPPGVTAGKVYLVTITGSIS